MEGVGSRLGRASSRYGPSATAAVFSGPVRKWKKKWVHVGSSSPSTGNHHNSHSNGRTNGNNYNSRLLLCRWTPLSPAAATTAAVGGASSEEEPPKRKFRYTPIAVLEERKKAAKKIEHDVDGGGTDQLTALQTPKNDEINHELNSDSDLKTENQDSNMSNLDLGLCLKGHSSDQDSVGESNDGQSKKASSGSFWATN